MDAIAIPRKPVSSSHINAVGYDAKTKTLVVEFPAAIWSYTPVESSMHKAMMSAESVGGYFHRMIKTNGALTAERLDT